MRGRNNNGGNRKGPNPLTRSYESNGPDVKIRGTAQHIGEKYLQLARDAQMSGDPVSAENYLQHAEHYFRIIAAAHQAQQQLQTGYVRPPGEAEVDDGDDEEDMLPDRFAPLSERIAPQAFNQAPAQPFGQQQPPYGDRPQGFNGERPNGQERYDRQDRGDRPDRGDRQDRGDRPEGQERPPRQERFGGYDNRQDRGDRQSGGYQGQDRQQSGYQNDRQPNGYQGQDRQQGGYQERGGYDRPQGDRQGYNNGQRFDRSDRQDRPDRQDRQDRNRNRYPRDDQRDYRNDPGYRDQPRVGPPPVRDVAEARAPAPQPDFEPESGPELPAFITAPVRAAPVAEPEPAIAEVPEIAASAPERAAEEPASIETPAEEFAVRPRRRRRPRAAMVESETGSGEGGSSES